MDFIPASSPSRKSSTSVLYPLLSAQRVYILYNILAQSQDSVPPAPALIFTMALFLSYSPDKRVSILVFSNSSINSFVSCSTSSTIEASFSSSPISIKVPRSSYFCWRCSMVSRLSFNCFNSFVISWDLVKLSQNPCSSIIPSISSILSFFACMSKALRSSSNWSAYWFHWYLYCSSSTTSYLNLTFSKFLKKKGVV